VRVFCGEQGVQPEAELDDLDERATHVIALADGAVIGTCRLLLLNDGECRLGRMAVEADRRDEGIGRGLLAAAEAEAGRAGANEVVLHAQTQAEPFYAASGYVPEGERFMEEGIEHIEMHKQLEWVRR
jgi:predicted GNAT family N-acyltransferase